MLLYSLVRFGLGKHTTAGLSLLKTRRAPCRGRCCFAENGDTGSRWQDLGQCLFLNGVRSTLVYACNLPGTTFVHISFSLDSCKQWHSQRSHQVVTVSAVTTRKWNIRFSLFHLEKQPLPSSSKCVHLRSTCKAYFNFTYKQNAGQSTLEKLLYHNFTSIFMTFRKGFKNQLSCVCLKTLGSHIEN